MIKRRVEEQPNKTSIAASQDHRNAEARNILADLQAACTKHASSLQELKAHLSEPGLPTLRSKLERESRAGSTNRVLEVTAKAEISILQSAAASVKLQARLAAERNSGSLREQQRWVQLKTSFDGFAQGGAGLQLPPTPQGTGWLNRRAQEEFREANKADLIAAHTFEFRHPHAAESPIAESRFEESLRAELEQLKADFSEINMRASRRQQQDIIEELDRVQSAYSQAEVTVAKQQKEVQRTIQESQAQLLANRSETESLQTELGLLKADFSEMSMKASKQQDAHLEELGRVEAAYSEAEAAVAEQQKEVQRTIQESQGQLLASRSETELLHTELGLLKADFSEMNLRASKQQGDHLEELGRVEAAYAEAEAAVAEQQKEVQRTIQESQAQLLANRSETKLLQTELGQLKADCSEINLRANQQQDAHLEELGRVETAYAEAEAAVAEQQKEVQRIIEESQAELLVNRSEKESLHAELELLKAEMSSSKVMAETQKQQAEKMSSSEERFQLRSPRSELTERTGLADSASEEFQLGSALSRLAKRTGPAASASEEMSEVQLASVAEENGPANSENPEISARDLTASGRVVQTTTVPDGRVGDRSDSDIIASAYTAAAAPAPESSQRDSEYGDYNGVTPDFAAFHRQRVEASEQLSRTRANWRKSEDRTPVPPPADIDTKEQLDYSPNNVRQRVRAWEQLSRAGAYWPTAEDKAATPPAAEIQEQHDRSPNHVTEADTDLFDTGETEATLGSITKHFGHAEVLLSTEACTSSDQTRCASEPPALHLSHLQTLQQLRTKFAVATDTGISHVAASLEKVDDFDCPLRHASPADMASKEVGTNAHDRHEWPAEGVQHGAQSPQQTIDDRERVGITTWEGDNGDVTVVAFAPVHPTAVARRTPEPLKMAAEGVIGQLQHLEGFWNGCRNEFDQKCVIDNHEIEILRDPSLEGTPSSTGTRGASPRFTS
eukprot:TRINITY_DN9539_c0_g1_i1.p1 TRINITY_DN9539_c0_g1~~TRINITY_DN9539_c0_g1_i1.p1  ORF type:complete len:961 (-),score=239.31 TRINITY_DN9539_c0_g1_i1:440-3322(-)